MVALSTPSCKPVTIGVVGLNFGKRIIEQLTHSPANRWCRLAGVCDLDRAKAEQVATETSVGIYHDLEALLADPSVEAVGLFTSPVGRAGLIRKIIRSGKHVMTTKPFERDVAAAIDVLNEARELGRIVHLNSPSPRLPGDLAQIHQWQESLKLGRPVACRAEVWASYREQTDGSWYDDAEACPVAPIYRLGIYLINDMVQLLGEAHSVQVVQSRLFTNRPTPDNAQLSIEFKNGAIGNLFASFCVDDGQFYSNGLVINYENGTVQRNMEPREYGQVHAGTRLSVVAKTGERKSIVEHFETTDVSGNYQWQEFAEAIRTGRSCSERASGKIIHAIRVIGAMARAHRSGNTEFVN